MGYFVSVRHFLFCLLKKKKTQGFELLFMASVLPQSGGYTIKILYHLFCKHKNNVDHNYKDKQ